jgi:hypothetical protein
MYVIKSEVQSWADAASINAALQLDGTRAGLNNAANAVSTTAGKWEFGTKSFTSPTVLFALTTSSPWYTAAAAPLNSSYARVTVTVPVSLYFLPAVTGSKFGNVSVRATAAQVAKTTFSEGLFPFSPYMHDSTGPNFGLVAGRLYTLRWPANQSSAMAAMSATATGFRTWWLWRTPPAAKSAATLRTPARP